MHNLAFNERALVNAYAHALFRHMQETDDILHWDASIVNTFYRRYA